MLTHSRLGEPAGSLPDRRTTLAAIADRANVSVATVSKVVNGRTGVGEDTRERVRAVIAELGYTTLGERQLAASRLAEPTFELLVEPFDDRNPYCSRSSRARWRPPATSAPRSSRVAST